MIWGPSITGKPTAQPTPLREPARYAGLSLVVLAQVLVNQKLTPFVSVDLKHWQPRSCGAWCHVLIVSRWDARISIENLCSGRWPQVQAEIEFVIVVPMYRQRLESGNPMRA